MKTLRILFVFALSAFVLTACASDGGGGSATEEKSSGRSGSRASYSDAPAGTPFAEVQKNMDDNAVRKILGNPDRANAYMTGKAFIPFYFGSDVARTDWFYSGQGRVVFSRNRYTGALKVIEILYDADEP